MDGGDWDPTYDGFALDGRGSRARTSPLEGHATRGPQNNKEGENHLKENRCPHSGKFTR